MQEVDINSIVQNPSFKNYSPEAQDDFLSKHSAKWRSFSPDARKQFLEKHVGKEGELRAPEGDPFNEMIKSQFIKNRPIEEARRLLTARSKYFAGLKLDQQDKILSKLPGPPNEVASTAGNVAEGMGQAVQGVAKYALNTVPEAIKAPNTPEEIGRHRRHPNLFAEPGPGVGRTLDRLILDPHIREYGRAKKGFQELNKPGGVNKKAKASEAAGHALAAVTPGGPGAAALGEQLGQVGSRAELEKTIGFVGATAIMAAITGKITGKVEPSKRMASALGTGAAELREIAPDIGRVASRTGRPTTVGHLSDIIRETGRDLESQKNVLLQPIAGQNRVPAEVAQALLAEANKTVYTKTPEGMQTRAYLRSKALSYMRPWTLGELDAQRMLEYNARVEGKGAVGQMQAIRGSDEVLASKIIEDNLRDIVYDDIAAHYGNSVNVRLLKKKQSMILGIQDKVAQRVKDLEQGQAEWQSASVGEKIGLSLSGHASGVTPRVHGVFKALKGGPEKAGNYQVRRAFPPKMQDLATKTGAVDAAKTAVRETTRQAIRNLPITALYEEAAEANKAEDKAKHKKQLTTLR